MTAIIPDVSRISRKVSEHPAVKAGREAEAARAAHNPEFWALLERLGRGHHPPPVVGPPPPSVGHLRLALLARKYGGAPPPRQATLRDIAQAAARGAAKYQRR